MKILDKTDTTTGKILAGLFAKEAVLGQIGAKWNGHLFTSRAANQLGCLAIDFYRKYNKPPGKKGIISLFEEWSEGENDEDYKSEVELLLRTIVETYEMNGDIVPEHVIDIAGRKFREINLNRLKEDLDQDLEAGRLDKAESRVAEFTKIELGGGAGVDVFVDKPAVYAAFDQERGEQIVKYAGDLETFFSNELERDSFVSFCGPQKSCKSHVLIDASWRAMKQRRRVAYFQIGDMTDRQVKLRFMARAANHPYRSPNGKWPCRIKFPVRISTGDDIANVDYEERTFNAPLDRETAWKACEKVMQESVKSTQSHFKMSCHPNLSVSILDIKSILMSWSHQNFNPDIVVIDYPDNLSPVNKGEKENRDKVNTTWKLMRALSQNLHCALLVGTQVNAAGFGKKWLDRGNFSEDNRKLSHVTGMVGLNITSAEKDKGLMRLNWIVKREGEYNMYRGVHCAGVLGVSNPFLRVCNT